jgi:hypothetical protein
MQDINKIAEIKQLLESITESNEAYSDADRGIYFDYDSVINLLKTVQEQINDTVRCPRPADLPENMVWSEKFYDSKEDFDPYVYDGSMTPEDYEKGMTAYQADKERG